MRWGVLVFVCAMAGCASNQLASAPPPGVDLSGHWTLNLADSDDALRPRVLMAVGAVRAAGVEAGSEGTAAWDPAPGVPPAL